MTEKPVIPNYSGPNLTGIMPGCLLRGPGQRPQWFPEPLQGATKIVLLLLDGLGAERVAVAERRTDERGEWDDDVGGFELGCEKFFVADIAEDEVEIRIGTEVKEWRLAEQEVVEDGDFEAGGEEMFAKD